MPSDRHLQSLDIGDISASEIDMVRRIAIWAHKIYCGEDVKAVISIDDLYHTGIVGLLEAKQNLDPERNLDAYVAIRVRGSVLDTLRKQLQVRVPRDQWRQAKIVQKTAENIRRTGEPVTSEAIARHLGWPVETVHKALSVRLSFVRVISEREKTDDNALSKDEIPTDPSPSPEDCVMKADLAKMMQLCLEGITDCRDRVILICRLVHRLELKMLARVMGFSIEGIRQKEIRAKDQMKQCLESRGWSKDSLK